MEQVHLAQTVSDRVVIQTRVPRNAKLVRRESRPQHKPRERTRGSRLAKPAVMAADLLAIAAAMALAAWTWDGFATRPEALTPIIAVGVISLPVWVLVF